MADHEIEIQAPTWTDIIHLQSLETTQDRQARYLRMKENAQATGIPLDHWYRKIGTVIGALDDTQDILATALWIGRKLLPGLLLRAAPVVGSALLVADALNLINTVLALTQPTGAIEAAARRQLKRQVTSKGIKNLPTREKLRRITSDYIKRRTGLGDILQAAQALDTLTDHGLRLGPLYGYVNDIVMAAYQQAVNAGRQVMGR